MHSEHQCMIDMSLHDPWDTSILNVSITSYTDYCQDLMIEGNCQCVWIYSYFVFLSDLRSMYMKHIGILNNTVNSINTK